MAKGYEISANSQHYQVLCIHVVFSIRFLQQLCAARTLYKNVRVLFFLSLNLLHILSLRVLIKGMNDLLCILQFRITRHQLL